MFLLLRKSVELKVELAEHFIDENVSLFVLIYFIYRFKYDQCKHKWDISFVTKLNFVQGKIKVS